MNKVIFTGFVGKDPEIKTFENGGEIATFSVASKERGYQLQDGRTIPEVTTWMNVVVKGGLTKVVRDYVNKGSHVLVEGSLRNREWEDTTSGVKKFITEIIVNPMGTGSLDLLGGNPNSNGNSFKQAAPAQQQQQYQQVPPQQQYQQQYQQTPPQQQQQQYQQAPPAQQQQQYQPPQQQQYQQAPPQQYQQPAQQPYYGSAKDNSGDLPF
jgi:single-strand DNA-binding protein